MKDADFYRTKIIQIVNSTNDVVFLRRLYKLIRIILRIDNEWILNQIERFLDNIQK